VDTVLDKAGLGGSSPVNAEFGGDTILNDVLKGQPGMCGAEISNRIQACKQDPRLVRPVGIRGWPAVCRDAYDDTITPSGKRLIYLDGFGRQRTAEAGSYLLTQRPSCYSPR
jgi:hypothetical protein